MKLDIDTELGRLTPADCPPWRFDSPVTALMRLYAKVFADSQRNRKAQEQRRASPIYVASLVEQEAAIGDFLSKLLRRHVLWPWLEGKRGFGSHLTARALGEIGHPGRFPGQLCGAEKPHYTTPTFEVGVPCPAVVWAETSSGGHEQQPCSATMLSPRIKPDMTGVRSVWHYAGLHTVNGQAARLALLKREDGGYNARDWNPALRTMLMMPNMGLAAQIVKHKPEPFYSEHPTNSYLIKLGQKAAELGAVEPVEGAKPTVEWLKAKSIARTVAIKLWLGDAFMAWKQAVPTGAV